MRRRFGPQFRGKWVASGRTARYDPAMPGDSYNAVLGELKTKKHVVVITHVKPDGDALGSAAAMIVGMRRKGIESRLLLFDPPPAKYAFLLKQNQIDWFDVAKGWPANVDLQSFDALLVVDTGTWSQLPGLKEKLANFKSPKMVVDHHLTQEDWADLKLVETEAAAAGEIVAGLLKRWDVPLDEAIATLLYLAIATDTGWFQFANTRPQTLRLAADLLEAGADAERVYLAAYQNERPQRLALMTRALQSLELSAGGRLAVMSLSKSDFQQTGGSGADTENLINVPMQVESVEVCLFLAEQPDGGPVRVSLRSKGKVDVAAFAQKYQGGGHARAAGLKIDGDLASARRTLTDALIAVLARK
jgi:bifunctional oligoribonuclease and PAP phosphatase NrnA